MGDFLKTKNRIVFASLKRKWKAKLKLKWDMFVEIKCNKSEFTRFLSLR